MPTLIIEAYDGRVRIAAPGQVPPEMMADAEEVSSLEEAAQLVIDVLGPEQGNSEQQPGDGASEEAAEPQGQPPQEDAMEQGFRNVRGAPR